MLHASHISQHRNIIRETSRFNGMVLGCFGCWFFSKVPETWGFQPQIGALRCLRTKLWPWGDIRQLWMVAWRLAPRGRCYAENHPGLRFTRNYFEYTYIYIYKYIILWFWCKHSFTWILFFKSKHCYKKAHMPLQSGFLWALVGYVGAPPGSFMLVYAILGFQLMLQIL